MVKNCKNRLLTVHAAAAYELEPDTISYLTGSGKTTKKIKDILEEAISLRDAETHAEDYSPDSFLPSNPPPAEELESFPDESQSDLSTFL